MSPSPMKTIISTCLLELGAQTIEVNAHKKSVGEKTNENENARIHNYYY
jgi:hypothetical protein